MDIMTRDSFFKAINLSALSGAYLLHGEEWYIMDSAVKRLVSSTDEAMRDMNVSFFDAGGAMDIISACETAPFLAERRIVIVRFMPRGDDGAALVSYIPTLPEYTLLLFEIKTDKDHPLDKRASLVKLFAGQGRAVEFSPLSPNEAAQWLRQRASSSGVMLSNPDSLFFATVAGTDCASLENELKKAADYVGENGTITKAVIDLVVTKDIEYIIFSVLDHIIAGRTADGFTALRSVMDKGLRAMDAASVLADKARLILQARRGIDKKRPADKIKAELGVSPGYAAVAYKAASLLSPSRIAPLKRCASALYGVTTMQFTGQGRDSELLEKALIELAIK